MSSLNRIKVSGYKSIREMDLQLNALNVLIGANGSGKSNFISVFHLLNRLVQQELQLFVGISGGAENLLYYGSKVTKEIRFQLFFGQSKYDVYFMPAQGAKMVLREGISSTSPDYMPPYIDTLGSGQLETTLFSAATATPGIKVADDIIASINGCMVFHFNDTSVGAEIKQMGYVDDNSRLRPDGANLAAFLFLLRETSLEHYKRIVRTIQLVAPFFENFMLRRSPLNKIQIKLEWHEKGSDRYSDANALSDGTLRFMCLATLLLQPDLPSTILIDEPELGLHPYALTLLAGLLRSAATKTQIIVATQSVPLINQFAPEDVIVVDRKDGQSTFERLNSETLVHWLEDYSLGDLWEKNVIGGTPQRWTPIR